MPRQRPPEGYLQLKDAVKFLNDHGLHVGEGMIYKYVKQERLKREGPPSRKQKYYSIDALKRIIMEEVGRIGDTDVQFFQATVEDLEKITQLSAKLFKTATLRPIPTETRRAWYEKENRGHYVVKRPNGDVVAYLHILALTDERIEAYMRDEIRGRDIRGEDVQKLEPGKPIGCIVVSIGSDPDIKDKAQRHRHTGVLLHGVSKEFEQLGERGIIIPRLYACTESKDGILMSVRMKMRQYAEPIKNRYTYWLDTLQSPISLVRGYQRALGAWFIRNPEHALALAEWRQQHHPGDPPKQG
jgi:hypothetical protein